MDQPRSPDLPFFITIDLLIIAPLLVWVQLFVESFTLLCLAGRASQVAQWVKNLPAVQEMLEMRVRFLGQEDPLEEAWQPTPVFLAAESHGQKSLVGYSPWGHKVFDMMEVTGRSHS